MKLSEQLATELNDGLRKLRERGASVEERIAYAKPLAAAYGRTWAYEDISSCLRVGLTKASPATLKALGKACGGK